MVISLWFCHQHQKCNIWGSNIVAISGSLFILKIQYCQTQCEGGARDVNNIWVPEILFLNWIPSFGFISANFLKPVFGTSIGNIPLSWRGVHWVMWHWSPPSITYENWEWLFTIKFKVATVNHFCHQYTLLF